MGYIDSSQNLPIKEATTIFKLSRPFHIRLSGIRSLAKAVWYPGTYLVDVDFGNISDLEHTRDLLHECTGLTGPTEPVEYVQTYKRGLQLKLL